MNLSATRCSSCRCVATTTQPMPPSPSSRSTRYLPASTVPGRERHRRGGSGERAGDASLARTDGRCRRSRRAPLTSGRGKRRAVVTTPRARQPVAAVARLTALRALPIAGRDAREGVSAHEARAASGVEQGAPGPPHPPPASRRRPESPEGAVGGGVGQQALFGCPQLSTQGRGAAAGRAAAVLLTALLVVRAVSRARDRLPAVVRDGGLAPAVASRVVGSAAGLVGSCSSRPGSQLTVSC